MSMTESCRVTAVGGDMGTLISSTGNVLEVTVEPDEGLREQSEGE